MCVCVYCIFFFCSYTLTLNSFSPETLWRTKLRHLVLAGTPSTSVKLRADVSAKVFTDPALFPLRRICIEGSVNLREITHLNIYSNGPGSASAHFFAAFRVCVCALCIERTVCRDLSGEEAGQLLFEYNYLSIKEKITTDQIFILFMYLFFYSICL